MDYETKLYLDKVIETIEKLDSPDWWIIILTIVNIGAFVFVAITQIKLQKQQTKLQEQQTKAQEYEVYRNLYRIVKRANSSIDSFLDDLWTALWADTYKFAPDYYKKQRQEILSLNEEFEINIYTL